MEDVYLLMTWTEKSSLSDGFTERTAPTYDYPKLIFNWADTDDCIWLDTANNIWLNYTFRGWPERTDLTASYTERSAPDDSFVVAGSIVASYTERTKET